jgi:hypothetical protein
MAFDGTCEIHRAGVTGDGRALLDLKSTDASFDWHWCFSAPERTAEVLAVALTAIATNKLVYCTMATLPLPDQPVVLNFALVK